MNELSKKYGIFSETNGWLVVCDATTCLFNQTPTFIMDFISESGAKGFLEILPVLHPDAPDCIVRVSEF